MKKCSLWAFSIVLFLFSFFVHAEAESPIAKLQHKLQNMVSLQGDFSQALYNAENKLLGEKNSGTFLLQRPGRFYWKTILPFEQLLVSDQETIWLYEPDLDQVTVRPFTDDLQQTPALLLSNNTNKLQASFNVTYKTQKTFDVFTLTPKEEGQLFSSLQMQFTGEFLTAMTINDSLGQQTVFTLSNTKINHPMDESLFSFSIPEGVDVMID